MQVARFHHCLKPGFWCGLVLLVTMGLAGAVAAAQDPLYTANLLVKTQSEAERNHAASKTLGEVVIRASGRSDAAAHPAIVAAQAAAINYLFGFSYSDYNATLTQGDAQIPAMTLSLNYSPEAIGKLLRSAQLPVWPNPRPKLLVWVVAEQSTGLEVQAPAEFKAQFNRVAALRGLPIILAEQDIEDQLSLAAMDLWRVNTRQIEMASLRYKADAVLIVRMSPVSHAPIPAPATAEELALGFADTSSAAASSSLSSDASSVSASFSSDAVVEPLPPQPWQLEWQLISHPEQPPVALRAQDFAEMATSVINAVTDAIAQRYAIAGGATQAGAYYLHIQGVNDFRAFKRAQDYLQSLKIFTRVSTVKSDAQSLLMKVETQGDLKLLLSTLSLGDRLQSMSDVNAILQPQASIPDSPLTPEIDAAAPLTQSEEALARALEAEFEQSLAAPVTPPAPVADLGSLDNPLVYQWLR